MIPNTDYGETITSGTMKTGAASIELTPEMFTLLSDGMYTDKVLAAIRETTCNARDAQVEAGVEQPLEMHLPTRLEPFYHVRDYGSGLSERQVLGYTELVKEFNEETGEVEEVEKHIPGLYLRYGKSTKRDSNLQIGGFGIGCKAPLAYSDSFLVESYQQGVVKTYTVYKENGIPKVAKLSVKDTIDPDGLKVKIAVAAQDTDTFTDKAVTFLKFFDFPINVTGRMVDTQVKYVLTSKLYNTVECGYSNRGKIVATMGGVVYKVADRYREELEQVVKQDMMLMKFEIGDLSVAGSRESLSEDDLTIAALDARVAEIKKDFYSVMRSEVEDPAHSPHEAIEIMRKYNLVTNNYQTSKLQCTKAAKGFTIGGVDAGVVLDRFNSKQVRTIDAFQHSHTDSTTKFTKFTTPPSILEVDRGSGYIKVAKQLSRVAGKSLLVALVNTGESEIADLQEYFGKDKVTVEKVSVKYAEFFPKLAKPAGKLTVAKSGLFNIRHTDIREIEEDQEGFYIPFERFECIMQGVPGNFKNFQNINPIIKLLIINDQLKQDEVFYSRKTGMRAVKKTKLKELNWDGVVKLLRKCYTAQDLTTHVYQSGKRNGKPSQGYHNALEKVWDKVNQDYPEWSDKPYTPTVGTKFLAGLATDIIALLEPLFPDRVDAVLFKFNQEKERFLKDFSILSMFSSWQHVSDQVTSDIIEFYEWKESQKAMTVAQQMVQAKAA